MRPPRLEPRILFSTVFADFNGDGFDDLAVGIVGEDLGVHTDAGAVQIFYSHRGGVVATDTQLWRQNSLGQTNNAGDRFGAALAAGDFNGDGYKDLAIGVPGEDIGPIVDAGSVHVLYGSRDGLTAANSQYWHQDQPGIANRADPYDHFGESLTVGNFNGDTNRATFRPIEDLVIGVPGEDQGRVSADSIRIGKINNAGALHVIYGDPAGLTVRPGTDQFFHQARSDLGNAASRYDDFAAALAAGDFNGDGRDDLAVGVPGEDIAGVPDVGAVHILYGSNSGVQASGDQVWYRNGFVTGISGSLRAYNYFGSSLAVGNFNGRFSSLSSRPIDDLAVSAPGVRVRGHENAGVVHAIYGREGHYTVGGGLHFADNQVWHRGVASINGTARTNDRFAASLAAGDFNGDAKDDLAVGAPLADIDGQTDAGLIQILFAGSNGISANDRVYHQDKPAIEDRARRGDHYGASLAAGRADDDHFADLAVGIPGENLLRSGRILYDSGTVNVLYGGPFDQFRIYDDQHLAAR
jgi:hypothetical protein